MKPPKISSIPASTMKPPSVSIPRRQNGGFSSQTLLFMFLIVIAFLIYLYSIHVAEIRASTGISAYTPSSNIGWGIDPNVFLIPRPSASMVATPTIGTRGFDVLSDPYIPPVKVDGYFFDSRSSDIRGIPPLVAPIQTMPVAPVNVETRGVQNQYSQVGILTKSDGSASGFRNSKKGTDMDSDSAIESRLILPLMGRRHMTGRDKWQYYAISNTGNLNTKLPIRSNGRSCTSEYGCDPLSSGDIVYVEGYNHAFKATVYENSIFSYLPVL